MNEQAPQRGDDGAQALADGAPTSTLVQRATRELRSRRDPRWVEVADRVLDRAMRATRRSYPVRAEAASGPVHLSEQVVITYLRDAVDTAVPDAALLRVDLHLTGQDVLAGVTLSLVARYGAPLIPVADRLRELASARLEELLGPVRAPVRVDVVHVHFDDVVAGDPAGADPWAGS